MHAFLLLTLVPGTAHATDLSWTCTTVTTPADVVVWRGRNLGAAQAGADAFDALRARVDADCLEDCSDPLGYFCPERTCVTAAGDLVTWSTDLSEEPSYYDDPSHYLTTIHVVVEPAPAAALGWTRAEATYQYAGYDRDYAVTWEGLLDPRWPFDGNFTASAERDSSLRSERWQDGTCVWVTESGYAIGGERVTMNGTTVWVSDPNEDRACGVSTAELGGARATINGVPQGLVDVDTWRPHPVGVRTPTTTATTPTPAPTPAPPRPGVTTSTRTATGGTAWRPKTGIWTAGPTIRTAAPPTQASTPARRRPGPRTA